mmetsp:Transcript_35158/g.98715  ORF Transcript_35158/g.98715 Transcript_35158/m.98715 type:complete len:298 (+) Transcript_35158:539-1432(+)
MGAAARRAGTMDREGLLQHIATGSRGPPRRRLRRLRPGGARGRCGSRSGGGSGGGGRGRGGAGARGHREGDGRVALFPLELCELGFLEAAAGHPLLYLLRQQSGMLILLTQLRRLHVLLLLRPEPRLRRVVDVLEVPTFRCFVNLALVRAAEVLHEVAECHPDGRVHVRVVPVRDEVAVDRVGEHARRPVAVAHELHEALLELLREVVHEAVGVLDEELHLALMPVGHAVALEAIFVPALLLAHLAVPTQLLEALGLHLVPQPFRRPNLLLRHCGGGRPPAGAGAAASSAPRTRACT